MKILSNKSYLKLTSEKRDKYLIEYLRHCLQTSISKMQTSDSYSLASWPYYQAELIGTQKTLNKLLKLVSND